MDATAPRSVVVVGYDGAELVDIACVTTALRMANELGAARPYRVLLATVDGKAIAAEGGLLLSVHLALPQLRTTDTLIVSGGQGHVAAARNPELVRQVRRLAERARRVASVCTGATVLAGTGLLDGRRVTTHWHYAADLARTYPAVRVDADPIFLRDGRFATSGGVTASLDLTLAFIEEDHGCELARAVAMGMVTYLQRPGSQAQISAFTHARRSAHAAVRTVLDYALAHPEQDLHADALAALVGLSTRQLNRLFRAHLGESPGRAVRRIRLEIAAHLITTSDLTVSRIARRCGFGSAESLRQAFFARYGTNPRAFRTRRAEAMAIAAPAAGDGGHPG
ncbi:GlxA family transcriptional regulator [Prauserella muralis]|uniref:AraC family transcriptional regulator n=1 Tax=Prauserella muralis TaxID=588067 RepID=A0A2V4B3H8_9PSEU|nr:helix-turn-helix domain-containing protein [Prauserella muralis]PXY27705.1 AraC family transcriptional regulator [Prauserella muralis]TWE22549.1 transcriptional regulator GlxA family with amidase domain [Prauserella muralis]